MYPIKFDLSSWKIENGSLKGKLLAEVVGDIPFTCKILEKKGFFEIPGDGLGFALKGGKIEAQEPLDLRAGDAVVLEGRAKWDGSGALLIIASTQAHEGRHLKTEKITPHHLQSDFHHQWVLLLRLKDFVVDRMDVFDRFVIGPIPKTFQIFFCVEEGATISTDGHTEKMQMYCAYCVPPECSKIALEGRCQVLRIRKD